jgi:hypothetical protein
LCICSHNIINYIVHFGVVVFADGGRAAAVGGAAVHRAAGEQRHSAAAGGATRGGRLRLVRQPGARHGTGASLRQRCHINII